MALSIANILLEVTGDSDDAQRALEEVSRDLALFGRETAEAEADLDTSAATAHLDELKARLAAFSADDHSTEVNVQIAKAQADLAVLQAELKHIDDESVVVDVDVRRGIVEKIGSLTGQVERLGESTEQAASGGISNLVGGLFDAQLGAGRFSASLGTILEVGPALVAVVIAIVGQLAAVIASAASAAGGIGALATAFGAALVPGIALGIGAVLRFKDEAGKAGTAAHALSGTLGAVGAAFQKATAGGSDALFRGLSDALRDIAPLVQSLGPAFTRLGQAGGDALRSLGEQFASPAWRKFFTFTTDSLARLTPLFAQSFGAFANILRNIATAAMPFLIKAFQGLADGLDVVAGKTSDIGGLRDVIGGMVHSLASFGHLIGGVTDLVGAFVQAFAPFGDSIVESLGDGAHNLADWLRSSEGIEKIKQFFEDTGPLASEVAKLLLNVSLALVQIGQFVAPALTPIVRGFNEILGVLNKVLSFLNDNISNGFRSAIGSILGLVVGFSKVGKAGELAAGAFRVVVGVLGALGGAFGSVASAIGSGFSAAFAAVVATARNIAQTAVSAVRAVAGAAKSAGQAVFNAVRAGFNAARGAVVAIARSIANAAVTAVRAVVGAARSAGSAVMNGVRGGLGAIRGAIVGVARSIASAAVSAVRAVVGAARGAGSAVMNAVASGFNAVRGAVQGAARSVGQGAINAIRAFVGAATSAGSSLINGIASGMRSAIGAVVGVAHSIWDAINAALPDITLNIHIPTPSVPHIDLPGPLASGVRDLASGGLHLVGEEGPELSFLPPGTDVYTAGETRRILRALAGGASGGGARVAGTPALAGAGGGGGDQYFSFHTPGTGNPDPRIAMAQAALFRRQKGRRTK